MFQSNVDKIVTTIDTIPGPRAALLWYMVCNEYNTDAK